MQYYGAFLVCRHLSSVCLKLIGQSAFEFILQERDDKALWLLSFFSPYFAACTCQQLCFVTSFAVIFLKILQPVGTPCCTGQFSPATMDILAKVTQMEGDHNYTQIFSY